MGANAFSDPADVTQMMRGVPWRWLAAAIRGALRLICATATGAAFLWRTLIGTIWHRCDVPDFAKS